MNPLRSLRLRNGNSPTSRAAGRITARRQGRRFRPWCERLEIRLTLSTDVWTGADESIDDDWSDPANWAGDETPEPGDSVIFSGGIGVPDPNCIVDQDAEVSGITFDQSWGATLTIESGVLLTVNGGFALHSGTITGKGDLSFSGTGTGSNASVWDGGTLAPLSGAIWTNSGTLTIDTSGGNLLENGGGTLTNSGTIDEQGLNTLFVENNFVLNNTGTYDFQGDCSFIALINDGEFGGATLINKGTVEKTLGNVTSSTPTVLECDFDNTGGTIDSEMGELNLSLPGGALDGGTLDADAGTHGLTTASIVITAEATLEGHFKGGGSGTVDLANSTLLLSVTNAGASFDFPANFFQWTSGTIDVSSGGTLTNTGFLDLDTTNQSVALNGSGTLLNEGRIDEAGGNDLLLERDATLKNTATYDFTSDSNITEAEGGTLVNTGLIEKTGGGATSVIQSQFDNNRGTIDVAVATLSLDPAFSSGSVSGGLIDGATLKVAKSATLNLTGGTTVDYQGTITGSGGGTIAMNGGTLAVTASGATFHMPGSLFQWTEGTIDVSSGGTLTNAAGSTLNLSTFGLGLNGAGTLANDGRLNAASNLVLENGATLSNAGTYDLTNDSNIAGAPGTLVNTGLIEKTGGSATSLIEATFDNDGGTIDVAVATLSLFTGAGTLIDGGTLKAAKNATFNLTRGFITIDCEGTIVGSGAGTVGLSIGSLVVTGSGAAFDMPGSLFQWSGGTIEVSSGATLINAAGSTLNLDTANQGLLLTGAGTLANDGTIRQSAGTGSAAISTTAFSNTGAVLVSAGALDISAAVTQVSGSTLTAGTWTVSGNSTLDITSAGSLTTIGTGAKVTVNQSSASFTNIGSSLTTVQSGGSLSLLSGKSLSIGGAFLNSGRLTLGPGSVLSVGGAFTEASTAGLTLQMGEVGSVSRIGSLFDGAGDVSLAGGLTVTSTVIPNGASDWVIVGTGGGGTLSGTFAGLSPGTSFTIVVGSTKLTFNISYSTSQAAISPRTDTWTGAGANANWTNASNWGGTVPTAGDVLVFGPGASSLTSTNNFAPGTAFNSIIFTGSGYAIGGNSVVLENVIDGSGATGANAFDANLTLGGPDTIIVGGSSTTLTLDGSTTTAGFTMTVDGGPGAVMISRGIGGGGGLDDACTGTLTLQAAVADTFTGGTIVSAGTLFLDDTGGVAIPGALTIGTSRVQLALANQIAPGATVTVNSSATLDLNGETNKMAALVLDQGTVTTGAGTLRVQTVTDTGSSSIAGNWALPAAATVTVNASSTLTVSAAIGGGFGLTMAGTGTLVLTGNNTYSGATTVAAGTLLVDGTQTASTITVKSGGTLGGSGTVGTVSVTSGGVLLPGPGAGATAILTTGEVKLASGSSFDVTLNGTTAGSQYDQLDAGGTISLGGSTLNVALGFTPAIGTTFTIIQNNSGGAISGTFDGLAQGATFTEDGMTFRISYKGGSGHDVTLTRTA